MKTIEFEQIKKVFPNEQLDERLIILDDISKIGKNLSHEPIKIDALIISYCQTGQLSVTIDDVERRIFPGDMLIYFPNQVLSTYLMSPDAKCGTMFCATAHVDKFVYIGKQIWASLKYIKNNPIIKIAEDEKNLLLAYYNIVAYNRKHPDARYRKETTDFLLHSFIFHLLTILESHHLTASTHDQTTNTDEMVRSGDVLFRRFIFLLSESKGRIRSVNESAEKLNVTPKYLSTVVKKASDRTALDWIHESITKEIEQQIRYSERSIKEIATDLNFPSLSFFTRFFREHFGMSPTEYRKKMYMSLKIKE